MATQHCANHPRRKAEALCMGCGQWFCSSCLQKVKDVTYCKKCSGTVGEDFRALAEELEVDKNSPGYIRPVVADEDGKWEKSFRSAQMIPVTKKRVGGLRRAVDLSGAIAGVFRRVVARVLDGLVTLGLVIVAYPVVASLVVVAPSTASDSPAVLGGALLLGLGAGLLVRFLFLTLLGQSIGRLIVGIRIVDIRGRPAGPIACFGRALFDTIFDLLVLPHVLSLFLIRPSRQRGSLGDAIVGTQTVRISEWRAKAQDAIYEEDRAKLLGSSE